jgi:hypothetical protein
VIGIVKYFGEVGSAITIAIILAAIVGGVAIYSFPSSPSPSSVSISTTSNTTTVASRTTPCGSPGAYCGRFEITSGSLLVNKSEAVLQVTLLEIGNMYIKSATVYVNGTVIGVPPASEYGPPGNILLNVQPGQQAVLVLSVLNSTIPIQVGRAYSVLVYGWMGLPGESNSGMPESINITAT